MKSKTDHGSSFFPQIQGGQQIFQAPSAGLFAASPGTDEVNLWGFQCLSPVL